MSQFPKRVIPVAVVLFLLTCPVRQAHATCLAIDQLPYFFDTSKTVTLYLCDHGDVLSDGTTCNNAPGKYCADTRISSGTGQAPIPNGDSSRYAHDDGSTGGNGGTGSKPITKNPGIEDRLRPAGDVRAGGPKNAAVPTDQRQVADGSDPLTPDGEATEVATDIRLPGLGFDFELTRSYRSGMSFYGPLGYSWDHNYNQTLRRRCDGSIDFSDGALHIFHFAPKETWADGRIVYAAPAGVALSLVEMPQPATGGPKSSTWVMVDAAGMQSSFDGYGHLVRIADSQGHSLSITWEGGIWLGWRIHTIVDTVGRQIDFIYDGGTGTLSWVWLHSGETLAGYGVGTDPDKPGFGELLSALDANGKRTTYEYHADPSNVAGYVPNAQLDTVCGYRCGTAPPACGPNPAVCRPDFINCSNFKGTPDQVAACQQSFAAANPYCSAPQGCVPACEQTYQPYRCVPGAEGGSVCTSVYWFGHPHELQHDLQRVYDGNGGLVLENVYDEDPTSPTFNKVIQQKWGGGVVTVEYHDLRLEASVPATPPPRLPGSRAPATPIVHRNPNVLTTSTFTSSAFCSATQSAAAFALVLTDVHGVTFTTYYDASWNPLRRINTANGETTEYVYDAAGFLAGITEPSGIRACMINDGWGRPLVVTTSPAPGYPGNAATHVVAFQYDGSGALTDVIDDPNGLAITTHIERDVQKRPHLIQQKVDVSTTLQTVLDYASGPLDYLQIITQPNQGKVTFDQFSVDGASARVTTAGAGETSPLVTTREFTRKGWPSTIRLPSGFQYDFAYTSGAQAGQTAQLKSVTRRMNALDPGAPIDTIGYLLDGDGRPAQVTSATSIQQLFYAVSDDVSRLDEQPINSADSAKPRRTCKKVTSDGRVLEIVRPEGNRVRFEYDASGRVVTVSKGYKVWSSDEGWAEACLQQIQAKQGAAPFETVMKVTYKAGGFVDTVEQAGLQRTFTVDGLGRAIEISDATGRRVRLGYDPQGRVIWRAVYDDKLAASGAYQLPQMGDAGLVAMTQYDFDYLGRPRSVGQWHLESATVAWTGIVRDDAHRLTTITRDGAVTTIQSDALGRPLSVTLPNQAKITFSYDGNNVHRSVTTPGGVDETVETYDGLGLLTRIASTNGKERLFEQHDLDGRPQVRRAEGGLDHAFVYDAYGRTRTESQSFVAPGKSTWIYGWDGNDRMVSALEPDWTYPTGGPAAYLFKYDSLDRMAGWEDPFHRVTSYQYEPGSERAYAESSPAGTTWMYHDAAGRLSQDYVTSSVGSGWRQYEYNALDLPTSVQHLASANGTPDSTVTMKWDSLGRRTFEQSSMSSYSVSHDYDAYGHHETRRVGPSSIDYQRDELGRVRDIQLNGRRIAAYVYNQGVLGGPQKAVYSNGATTFFGYDHRGRPYGSVVQQGNANLALSHDVWGVDDTPRQRMHWLTGGPMMSDYYLTDGAGRLVGENDNQSTTPTGQPPALLAGEPDNNAIQPYMKGPAVTALALDFDAAWASRSVAGKTTKHTVDQLHRLTAVNSDATAYDGDDNLTHVVADGTAQDFKYDPYKHPISAVVKQPFGSTAVIYRYDALGRRVQETNGGASSSHRIIWDGEQVIAVGDDSNGYRLEIPGDGLDEHVASVGGLGGTPADARFYHQNWDGSVLAMSSTAGLVEGYTYSGWGQRTTWSKGAPTQAAATSIFGFQGQLTDPWTGNPMMRARQYLPQLGRFSSQDPANFIDGLNRSAFVTGHPLTLTDPFGLESKKFKYEPLPVYPGSYADGGAGAALGTILWNWLFAEKKPDARDVAIVLSSATSVVLRRVEQNRAASTPTRPSVPKAPAIKTNHGDAEQDHSNESTEALAKVRAGATVYRQGRFGRQQTADGQFWSTQNPATTPDYAGKMGMPDGKDPPDWIMGGSVKPSAPAISRPAPAVGTNNGGHTEVVVEPGGVENLWFHMPE